MISNYKYYLLKLLIAIYNNVLFYWFVELFLEKLNLKDLKFRGINVS
jgi:hypothetical protein